MAVTNPQVGSRISRTIGHAGEQSDIQAGTLISEPMFQITNNRPALWASAILWRTNRDGEYFLDEAMVNLQYAGDRYDIVPALDGTENDPKSVQQLVKDKFDAFKAFNLTRPASAQAVTLSSLVAEDESKSAKKA